MLTPIEIQSKSFKSGGLGYDKKDVDAFKREVLANYEDLYRENMELNDKVAVLTEAIQNYKAMEKTLQRALVLAEKTAEETKNAALKEAKSIEIEARGKANLILADAKNDLDELHRKTLDMIQQYESYRAQFKSLAASQVELLSSKAYDINLADMDVFLARKEVSETLLKETENKVTGSAKPIEEKKEEISFDKVDPDDYTMEESEEFEVLDLNDDED